MNVIMCINKYSRGFLQVAQTGEDAYSSKIRKSEVAAFQVMVDNQYEVNNR